MLEALLPWIETEQLFAVLLEQDREAAPGTLPLARPPAVADQILLKRLVPADLYRTAMQTGWVGVHALSFALRHRITALQLIFHQQYEDVDVPLRQCLLDSWERSHGTDVLPLFGFSPLGIHVSWRPTGLCRAFDAFSLWSCLTPTHGIFCEAHAAEAFWNPQDGASQQALMFRYYAELQNFSQYGETDLEDMLGTFWKRYQAYAGGNLDEAIEYFGLRNVDELRDFGTQALRRKFLQLSLVHHPDRGGQEKDFVRLQTHYQRLKLYLAKVS
jgi:hypothetical protein